MIALLGQHLRGGVLCASPLHRTPSVGWPGQQSAREETEHAGRDRTSGNHPWRDGGRCLAWARQADAGPFSSLSIIDRLVYGNYEPLITLAVVAGVTTRIRLMPSVLLAPSRSAAVLASEAATLDALSGGRLTLGPGVGGREDDFRAAGASFNDRGRRFEEQLATMKQIWAGEAVSAEVGPIGPRLVQDGGPPILIGGLSPGCGAAGRRLG